MSHSSDEAISTYINELNAERHHFDAESTRLQPVYDWLVNDAINEWVTIIGAHFAECMRAAKSTCDEYLQDTDARNLTGESSEMWESRCLSRVLPDAIERTAGALGYGEIRDTVLSELPEHLEIFAPIDTVVLGRMMVRDSRFYSAVKTNTTH